MFRRLLPLVLLFGCDGDDSSDSETGADETGFPVVSYAACDDPSEGCAEEHCRRRSESGTDYSICIPPCSEDADCPIGAGGNVPVVCDATNRCSLECVPQVMSCPMGTMCIDGAPPQCMWPGGS